ncbi:hypothetical protein PUN28_001574 [Cardiocondyla obscurior]|uniref:BolA-like protein n=1 Tax=Cardiocondyla obscurior TaxID=286306 RepID=A0AAW2H632_9HYME
MCGEEYIQNKLFEELDAVYVHVEDQSDGCGAKFSITIVSDLFQGKTILHRHRLVYGALEEELKKIHAISITALTPEEHVEKTKN